MGSQSRFGLSALAWCSSQWSPCCDRKAHPIKSIHAPMKPWSAGAPYSLTWALVEKTTTGFALTNYMVELKATTYHQLGWLIGCESNETSYSYKQNSEILLSTFPHYDVRDVVEDREGIYTTRTVSVLYRL